MTRARAMLFAGLAAACVWHLALRWQALRLPLVEDEGEYAYAARVWSDGGLPYRDAYLQKPPMVLLFYRAAAAVSDDPRAPRAFAVLACWAVAALLALAAPNDWSFAARLAPAGVFASASTLPLGDYGFPANTEVFVALFSAVGFFFLSRESPAAAGLALGAALATKQTAALTLAAFAPLAAWQGSRRFDRGSLARFVLGAAVIPLLWAAYFAARGGLGALVDQVWARNRLYLAVLASPDAVSRQLRWFARAVAPGFLAGLGPAIVVAAFGCSSDVTERKRAEAGAAVWLATALAGAAAGFFLFPHYFLPAAAPLAFLCGAGIERLRWRRKAWLAAALAAWPAVASARLYFATPPATLAKRLLYPNPIAEAPLLAREIEARTTPEETVYVFGSEPQLYVYSGRRCATPHEVVYALTLFPRGRADVDAEWEALRRAPPRVVVYSAQPGSAIIGSEVGLRFRDEVRAWLAKDYRWIGRVDVGPDASRAAFGAREFAGKTVDWDAESSLFLFDRRSR